MPGWHIPSSLTPDPTHPAKLIKKVFNKHAFNELHLDASYAGIVMEIEMYESSSQSTLALRPGLFKLPRLRDSLTELLRGRYIKYIKKLLWLRCVGDRMGASLVQLGPSLC